MFNKNNYQIIELEEKKEADDEKKNKILIFFILFLLLILLAIIFFYNITIFSNFKFLISFMGTQREIKKIEKFVKLCNNKSKVIKQYKVIKNNPKISIISPLYNRERYILRLLKCIQNQNFQDIEIILFDDFSIDNSIKIIEDYKKVDKRIKLIKNKYNKGTFVSRNLAALYSKGKYIIIIDPDDIISKNILSMCYKYCEKYNYEMIRFNMYTATGKFTLDNIINQLNTFPIYQPDLSFYLFYGKKELEKIDYHIVNKFIKKEVYVKAINSIDNYYLNMHIIYRDDSIINYILYRISKSYIFIKKIGYYYGINSLGVTKNLFSRTDLRIKFAFVFLNIVFEYSKNTKYEKDMFNFLFTNFKKKFSPFHIFSALTRNPKYYYDFINEYLSCKFVTKENKIILKSFQKIIKNKI